MDPRRIPLIVTLAVGLVCALLTFGPTPAIGKSHPKWFHFFLNYNGNQNHDNWACHDYAHDMMNGTEPNAIFMTEGGDNQVFSLLYFSYAERKRPDVDFFDQKGNVFPRLYGDLMNMSPDDLDVIRDLRDFELFSTGRPVYLTWKRPALHTLTVANLMNKPAEVARAASQQGRRPYMRDWKLNSLADIENAMNTMVPTATFNMMMKTGGHLSNQHLKELGPWFFQTYGLLQRVTPIRYAIADALEIWLRSDIQTLRQYVRQVSAVDLSVEEFWRQVGLLQNEGLAERQGNTVVLKSPQKRPFGMKNEEYWSRYANRYTNSANAGDWDYLTIEIFNNYHSQQLQLAQERMQFYLDRSREGRTPEVANKLIAQSEKWKAEIFHQQEQLERWCYAVGGQVWFNGAGLYLRYNQNEKALANFEKAFVEDRLFFPLALPAGQNAALLYLQKAAGGPQSEESNHLMKARRIYKEISNLLVLNFKLNAQFPNMTQSREFQGMMQGIARVDAALTLPRAVVEAQIAKADKSGNPEDRVALARLYERRNEFEQAAYQYQILMAQVPRDTMLKIAFINAVIRFDPRRALEIMESVYQTDLVADAAKIDMRMQFEEQLGLMYMQMAGQSLSQNDIMTGLAFLNKSKEYLDRFRATGMPHTGNPEIRRRVINAEKAVRQAEGQIQQIRAYLGARV